MNARKGRVLQFLEQNGPSDVATIVTRTGIEPRLVVAACRALHDDGQIHIHGSAPGPRSSRTPRAVWGAGPAQDKAADVHPKVLKYGKPNYAPASPYQRPPVPEICRVFGMVAL